MVAVPRPNRPQPLVLVEVEQYHNPAPRKCIGFMLLISSLLVLRVQQDRYAEVLPYHGAKPDDRKFPWELQSLVSANSSFDATFLALPLMPGPAKSSTFVRSQSDPSMLITGAGNVLSLSGGEGREVSPNLEEVVAVATGRVGTLPGACPGGPDRPCYVGLQQDSPAASLRGSSSCFRFVAGSSGSTLQPLPPAAPGKEEEPGRLCIGSPRLRMRAATAAANGTVAVVWDLPTGNRREPQALSCMAVLGFPGMATTVINTVSWASTVLYDEVTSTIIAVGFHAEHHLGDMLSPDRPLLTISTYDAATLQPRMRYRLPLSTAWLLRARTSDGFLLFIGSEQPWFGATFVIDLKYNEVFAQDPPPPPGAPTRRRQRLPQKPFKEAPTGGVWADGTGPPSPTGPCSDMVQSRKVIP